MSKSKIITIFLFTMLALLNLSYSQQTDKKTNVGLYIDQRDVIGAQEFRNWIFEKINELNNQNEMYNYVFYDEEIGGNDMSAFKYMIEIDPAYLSFDQEAYNIVSYVEKEVPHKKSVTTVEVDSTGKEKKITKEITEYVKENVPVYESGVRIGLRCAYVGRMYNTSTGIYLNGFVVEYSDNFKFIDPDYKKTIDNINISTKDRQQIEVKLKQAEKNILEKYNSKIVSKKAKYKDDFLKYSINHIIYNTAYPFYYPQEITNLLTEDDENSKVVKLSGIKNLQDQQRDNVFELIDDDYGHKKYDRIAQFIMSDKYYDQNGAKVRLSAKKVREALEKKHKMVIGRYKEQYRFIDDSIKQKYSVIPIFEDYTPSSFEIYKVNNYLNDIPIFKVLERGSLNKIQEIQTFFKSQKALENGSYDLVDKQMGADFIVLIKNILGTKFNAELIETKSGKILNKSEITIPNNLSETINFYNLIIPAFKINTEISALGKASSGKAKSVYIKSMFPLKDNTTYDVFLLKKYEVNGELLDRTISIGVIKIDELYSRTYAIADVKQGSKEIYEAFSKGEKVICILNNEKKDFFTEIFNLDNYENLHIYSNELFSGSMGL